jgi:Tol biopolymer transport system component/DNA-binding winged helix-turn-helix (wHTH) protein
VATSHTSPACARFDQFQVDLSSGELRKSGGASLRIQQQPLQVLRLLLEAEGRVVTREELRVALWPEETFVDFEHGVNTAVKKLRQALEDSVDNPKFIETVPKVGYRFMVPVEWMSDSGRKRALLSDVAIAVPGEVPVPEPNPPERRRKLKALIALTVIFGVAATVSLSGENSYLARTRLGTLLRRIGAWHRIATLPTLTERRLTANPDDTPLTSGLISPDGKYLAYTDSTGFYLRQVDNGETRPLLLPKGFDPLAESWFPDSVHLVVSWVEDPQKPPSLWQISVMGGTARKLTHEGSSASVSPDASQIIFLKQEATGEEIWLMQADGDRAKKLVSSEEDNFGQLAWSPDGRRFAYSRTKTRYYTSRSGPDTKIEVFDLGSGQTTVVRSHGERGLPRGGAALGWMPDGRLIYPLREPRPNQQDTNLWWVRLDPAEVQPLGPATRLTSGHGIAVQLSLSNDGKRIALRRHAPQADIYVADLERSGKGLSKIQRLTLDERIDYATSWTPDSKAVLFYSNRDGPFHVFKQDINATQPELLVGGRDDLYMPRLSPDGSSVLYVVRPKPGGPSNNAQVMRAPLAGGPPQFVLEESAIWDIQCARIPYTLCIYSKIENGQQTFFTFDPVKGKGAELQAAEVDGDNFDWVLSPNGKYLAWARNRTTLKEFGVRVLSLAEGWKRDIAVPGWAEIYGLDWAADSKSLWAAANNRRGARALLNVGFDGKVRTTMSNQNAFLEWAIPSPDGRHLAIVQDSNTSNVWLLESF